MPAFDKHDVLDNWEYCDHYVCKTSAADLAAAGHGTCGQRTKQKHFKHVTVWHRLEEIMPSKPQLPGHKTIVRHRIDLHRGGPSQQIQEGCSDPWHAWTESSLNEHLPPEADAHH